MIKSLEIFTDGASSGNPGESGIGVVIRENGKIVSEISQAIGSGTNNFAEYTAVIYALQEALILKAEQVKINTDSELVYHQLTGSYKIKHPGLKYLFDQIQHLKKGFKKIELSCVPREQNRDADRLATQAIKKQAKMIAPLFDTSTSLSTTDEQTSKRGSGEESPGSEGNVSC